MQGVRRISSGDRLGADRSFNRLKFDIVFSTPWGIEGSEGWRLKLKEPSTTPGIDPGSQKWRFSARTKPGEYYNPVTGKTGTRGQYGHIDLDPN